MVKAIHVFHSTRDFFTNSELREGSQDSLLQPQPA
jgi:hypothetical protein